MSDDSELRGEVEVPLPRVVEVYEPRSRVVEVTRVGARGPMGPSATYESLGLGSAASAGVEDFATAAQGALADTAVQPEDLPTFGSAASATVEDFATAAQGLLAETALQPGDVLDGPTLFRSQYRQLAGDPYTLDDADGIIGGGGTILLPSAGLDPEAAPRAWVISAFMGPIALTPPSEEVIWDLQNSVVDDYVVSGGSVVHLLRYETVWRIIYDSSVTGGGGFDLSTMPADLFSDQRTWNPLQSYTQGQLAMRDGWLWAAKSDLAAVEQPVVLERWAGHSDDEVSLTPVDWQPGDVLVFAVLGDSPVIPDGDPAFALSPPGWQGISHYPGIDDLGEVGGYLMSWSQVEPPATAVLRNDPSAAEHAWFAWQVRGGVPSDYYDYTMRSSGAAATDVPTYVNFPAPGVELLAIAYRDAVVAPEQWYWDDGEVATSENSPDSDGWAIRGGERAYDSVNENDNESIWLGSPPPAIAASVGWWTLAAQFNEDDWTRLIRVPNRFVELSDVDVDSDDDGEVLTMEGGEINSRVPRWARIIDDLDDIGSSFYERNGNWTLHLDRAGQTSTLYRYDGSRWVPEISLASAIEGRFADLAKGLELIQQPTQQLNNSGDLGGDPVAGDLDPAGGVLVEFGEMNVGFAGALCPVPEAPVPGAELVGMRLRNVVVDLTGQSNTAPQVSATNPTFDGLVSGTVEVTGDGAGEWAAPAAGLLLATPTSQPAGAVDIVMTLDAPTSAPEFLIGGCVLAAAPTGPPPFSPHTSTSVESIEFLWAMPADEVEERFTDLARGYEMIQEPTEPLDNSGDLGGDSLDPSSDLDPAGGVNIVMGEMTVGFMGAISSTPTPPLDGALLLGVRLRGVLPLVGAMAGTGIGVSMPVPDFQAVAAGEVTISGSGAAAWQALTPGNLLAGCASQPVGPVDITLLLDTPAEDPAAVTAGVGISNTPIGAPPWTPAESVAVDRIEFLWAMPADPGGGPTPTATQLILTDFGAVGDGVTDDTVALEAAMAALAAGPVRTLFVPPGTYATRRPPQVPGGCTIYGVRGRSKITRFGAGAKAQITEDILGSTTTIPVDSSEGFSVGDCVLIFDTGNTDWVASFANVESLTETTITVDRPLNSAYVASLDAAVWRSFPLLSNTPYHGDDPEPTSTAPITVRDIELVGAGTGPAEPTNLFVNATAHFVQCEELLLDGLKVSNATTDAISVQGRFPGTLDGEGYPAKTLLHNCMVDGAGRHGIHLGTGHSGVRVEGNEVDGAEDMGLFLCMNVQDTVITGNVFRNCRQGIAGTDARERFGDALTTSTPLNNITGDVRCSITGNTFIGGPLSNVNGAVAAIQVGPQFSVTGNVIRNWLTGIALVPWACDAVVDANTISGSEVYAGGSYLVINAHCDRSRITNNIVRGGLGDDLTVKNDTGIQIEGPFEDVVISGNSITDCNRGLVVGPMNPGEYITNTRIVDNTLRRIMPGSIPFLVYGNLQDCSIDVTGFDMTDSVLFTGLIDFDAGSTVTRLLVNGVGDNGSVDPDVGGPWNAVSVDGRYEGTPVTWLDDSTLRVSRWFEGHGWVLVNPDPGSGDVVGPGSSEDGRPAIFDQSSGKLLKQGSATGAALVSAADAAAARTALGLGSAATAESSAFASAGHSHAALAQISATVPSGNGYSNLGSFGTANVTAQLTAVNRRVFVPIFLVADTFTRIGVNVTAAAVSTWRLGIHSMAANGLPTAAVLAEFGTLDMNLATGRRDITINWTAPATGWYWVQIQCDAYTATPTVTSVAGQGSHPVVPLGMPTDVANVTRSRAGFYDTLGTGGALGNAPTSWSSVVFQNDTPRVWIYKA